MSQTSELLAAAVQQVAGLHVTGAAGAAQILAAFGPALSAPLGALIPAGIQLITGRLDAGPAIRAQTPALLAALDTGLAAIVDPAHIRTVAMAAMVRMTGGDDEHSHQCDRDPNKPRRDHLTVLPIQAPTHW